MMGKTAYEKILKYKYYVLTGINKEGRDEKKILDNTYYCLAVDDYPN